MKWKKQMESMSRLMIYLMIIGFVPSILVGYDFFKKKQKWETIASRLGTVRYLSEIKTRKQATNQLIRGKYSEVDPFYIDNQLESFSFLNKEQEALEKILQSPTFTGNEWVEKRYAAISGENNLLQFVQQEPQTKDGFQESMATLLHPVEVDIHDIKALLTHLEAYHPSSPQLLVTDLKLNRKINSQESEVYELTINLLKREFLK